VVEECPVAPGRTAARAAAPDVPLPRPALLPSGAARPAGPGRPGDDLPDDRTTAGDTSQENRTTRPAAGRTPAGLGTAARSGRPSGGPRSGETKTARFLALVAEEHGPLAAIPLDSVARIAAVFASRVGLHAGSARTALRRAVLAAHAESTRTPRNEETPAKGAR
jgi:hypothetical protein